MGRTSRRNDRFDPLQQVAFGFGLSGASLVIVAPIALKSGFIGVGGPYHGRLNANRSD